MMNIKIEITNQENAISKEFNCQVINIGSLDSNDLVFDSEEVSPNHALIKIDGEKVLIYNHSTNGTYVNGNLVDKEVISDGSIIQLGLHGPTFKVIFSKDDNELPVYTDNTSMSKRWYDRNTLISKAMLLLKNANDEKTERISNELIKILNKQDAKSIFVVENFNIDAEIKALPQQLRYYDLNKTLQKVIESLKLCTPEFQDDFSLEMIKLLDPEVKDKTIEELPKGICPFCQRENVPTSLFCIGCGSKLKQDNNPIAESINCPKCQKSNLKDSSFCIGCGFPLQETQSSPDINKSEQTNTINCPECGNDNQVDTKFCIKCGFPLQETKSNPEINTLERSNTINCPECGNVNQVNTKFCMYCGYKLNIENPNKLKSKPYYLSHNEDKPNFLFWGILIGTIVLIVVLVIIFYPKISNSVNNLSQNTPSSQNTSKDQNEIKTIPEDDSIFNKPTKPSSNKTFTGKNSVVIQRFDDYALKNSKYCRVYLRPTYDSHFLSEEELKAQHGNVDYVYCGTKAEVLEYNEPIYKIKTDDGRVGWIYAATVTQKNLPEKFDTTICRLNKNVKMILPNSQEGQMIKGSSFVVISQNTANDVYNVVHSNGTFASVKMFDCTIDDDTYLGNIPKQSKNTKIVSNKKSIKPKSKQVAKSKKITGWEIDNGFDASMYSARGVLGYEQYKQMLEKGKKKGQIPANYYKFLD